ncbi:MAG: hypothetical protein LBI68_01890 [Azoarcus sp.]|jgi:hypothetical protein|nr:hypothetical protein [Azoarcus sp.]
MAIRPQAQIGVALNFLGVLAITARLSEDFAPSSSFAAGLTAAIWLSWGISVLGLILGGSGKKKLGAILVIAGSILFVPMGLVAVFGAKKMLNAEEKCDIDARRQFASTNDGTPLPPA